MCGNALALFMHLSFQGLVKWLGSLRRESPDNLHRAAGVGEIMMMILICTATKTKAMPIMKMLTGIEQLALLRSHFV